MADIAFDYTCDKDTGFLMNPNVHKTFGYVTSLNGFGLGAALATDLQVYISYNTDAGPEYSILKGLYTKGSGASPVGTAKVVGVMEHFVWSGAVGAPIEIDVWMSQENAFQIKALQQLTLKDTKVSELSWWIGDYDQETKMWYEKSHPLGSGKVTGNINGQDGNMDLDVDLVGAQAASGIDVLVYKVTLKVVPGANQQYTFRMANSSTKPTVKSWGLVVGTLAAGQLKPV